MPSWVRMFVGTTRAGRELELFYDGSKTGQAMLESVTARLNGVPIDTVGLSMYSDAVVVRSSEYGTFTAAEGTDSRRHTDALRRYLDSRPARMWSAGMETLD